MRIQKFKLSNTKIAEDSYTKIIFDLSKSLFLYFHRCLDTPTERRKSAGQRCSLFSHFRFFVGIGTLENIFPVPCSVWRLGYVHDHVLVKCPCFCPWSYPCPSPCSCPCVSFCHAFFNGQISRHGQGHSHRHAHWHWHRCWHKLGQPDIYMDNC